MKEYLREGDDEILGTDADEEDSDRDGADDVRDFAELESKDTADMEIGRASGRERG